MLESNSRAIAALSERTSELQAGQARLQEGQALLVQIVSQQQDMLQEFRRTTNAALERMERNQTAMQQEIISIRRDMSNR